MANIQISSLNKMFKTESGEEFVALKDVNLSINDKEFVAVVGTSGGGKTTLLNVIAGLLEPSSGHIQVGNKEVKSPGRDRGVVFQQDSVFMWRTVLKNVEYGMEMARVPKKDRYERAMHCLRIVGLEKFASFYPKELSGGMKKRVQIATVFANNPEVLLMDEPYGALDYPTKCALQEELLNILQQEPKTTVFVTHDIEEAVFLADRIVCMKAGAVTKIIDVPFKRPRISDNRMTAEFAELKQLIWNHLESRGGETVEAG